MPQLPQAAHRLHPTKNLFDQLALPLADLVTGVARGARIDRAVVLLPHVRRDLQLTHRRHKAGDIEVLILTLARTRPR
jgi:hypothetical protein